MVSGGGIAVQLDECVVDAHGPVADEDDACALGPRAQGDRVDRRGLQLGEIDAAARSSSSASAPRRARLVEDSTGSGIASTRVPPVVKTATRASSETSSSGSAWSENGTAPG